MKVFLLTIGTIIITGSIATTLQAEKNINFDKQENRVDSMIVVVDKIDRQLNQISK